MLCLTLSSYMLERENPTRSIFWLVGFCHLNVNVNSDFRFDCIVYILPGSLYLPSIYCLLKVSIDKANPKLISNAFKTRLCQIDFIGQDRTEKKMRINWGGLHPRTAAALMENVFLCLIVGLFLQVNGKETCTSQVSFGGLSIRHTLWKIHFQFFLNTLGDARVQTKASTFKDCKQVSFEGSEKLNSHLGAIRLTASVDTDNAYLLNVSFSNIKWRSKLVVTKILFHASFCVLICLSRIFSY